MAVDAGHESRLSYLFQRYILIQSMNTSTVTVKGQIVIPSRLRRKYGIKKGTRICFYDRDGEIGMIPVTEDSIDANVGFLETKGKLLQALRREKQSELEK